MTIDFGKAAEHLFINKVLENGSVPLLPMSEITPYDVVIDNGKKTIKIQIKSTHSKHHKKDKYKVSSVKCNGDNYTKKDCDFMVYYIFNTKTWYIVPVKMVSQYYVNLYPHRIPKKGFGRYEKYREAWHLLKE